MAQLTPADFNKPCLMTYGEIAERLHFWARETMTGADRTNSAGDLGPIWPQEGGETSQAYGARLAAGLLKLSTEDVR